MTDVSSWSPVDESNTAAPPNGWPEFMMPSGVNNVGRMMMGAVRRMYDQQINGTIALPYLRLSGGTVSGSTTFAVPLTIAAATTGAHATRKDYVDQRDTDWYNTAWSNITGWAAGQDTYYYNAAINHANTLDSNQRGYIDGQVAGANANANNRVWKGGDSMSGALGTPYIHGGPADAGTLLCYGGHTVCFRWDNSNLYYRVDEANDIRITWGRNAWNIGFEPTGGSPTGWTFGATDGGTWFYCFCDLLASDERIKSSIAASQVDALNLLDRLQISQFDIKPEAAAWCQSVGKTPEERAQMLPGAAVHVDIGFVAQQVQQVIPEAVFCANQHGLSPGGPLPDDILTINSQMFTPYLVRAVQQLSARLEALEGRMP